MQISNDVLPLENELTVEQIVKEAYQGRYYSLETHRWKSLSMSERFLRALFWFAGTSFQTCMDHSWNTIGSMKLLPKGIDQRIAELYESRGNKGLFDNTIANIAKVYVRVLQANGAEHFEVRIDRNNRFFRLLEKEDWISPSPIWGNFIFNNKENTKIVTNESQPFFQNDDNLISRTRIIDTWEEYKIELLNPKKEIIAILSQEGRDTSLVLRDQTTHKILALVLCNQESPRYSSYKDWNVTLLDLEALRKKNLTNDIITWAIITREIDIEKAEMKAAAAINAAAAGFVSMQGNFSCN